MIFYIYDEACNVNALIIYVFFLKSWILRTFLLPNILHCEVVSKV